MAKVQILVWGWRCERCGHEWLPRDKENSPRVCPKCKSPYWDRPKRDKGTEPDGGTASAPDHEGENEQPAGSEPVRKKK